MWQRNINENGALRIPIYIMSCFKTSRGLYSKVKSLMSNFCWDSELNNVKSVGEIEKNCAHQNTRVASTSKSYGIST